MSSFVILYDLKKKKSESEYEVFNLELGKKFKLLRLMPNAWLINTDSNSIMIGMELSSIIKKSDDVLMFELDGYCTESGLDETLKSKLVEYALIYSLEANG